MWSFSSEEIQIRTHSQTTQCHIQGTEVDVLSDLIVGANFVVTLLRSYAFSTNKTFMGNPRRSRDLAKRCHTIPNQNSQ